MAVKSLWDQIKKMTTRVVKFYILFSLRGLRDGVLLCLGHHEVVQHEQNDTAPV